MLPEPCEMMTFWYRPSGRWLNLPHHVTVVQRDDTDSIEYTVSIPNEHTEFF